MKKILKTIVCCLGALAIAFTAFFVPNINKSASASVIGLTWTGTNLQTPYGSITSNGGNINSPVDNYSVITFKPGITISGSSVNGFTFNFYQQASFYNNASFKPWEQQGTYNYTYNSTGHIVISHIYLPNSTNMFRFILMVIPNSDAGPTLNMKTYEVGYYGSFMSNVPSSYFGSLSTTSEFSNLNNNFVIHSYTDTANWRYIWCLRSYYAFNDNWGLNYNIYYQKSEVDFTDNDIYNEGYSDGYSEGLDVGESNGYNSGYNSGYNVGFGNGRNEGIQNANNYSFLGLFGAMIDAPLNGLRSLFNFEFLGINLLSFITSLLTIALITFVIKKLMGR